MNGSSYWRNMKMFEKIHVSDLRRLTEEEMENLFEDWFLYPITTKEKQWLKGAIQLEEASWFLEKETIEKVKDILKEEPLSSIEPFLKEKFVVHSNVKMSDREKGYLKLLFDILTSQNGFRLSYHTNAGKYFEEISGIPFKLEFSMAKKQWYILWLGLHVKNQMIMLTPLRHVNALEAIEVNQYDFVQLQKQFNQFLEEEMLSVTLKLNNRFFQSIKRDIHEEKHRIFYNFSCFDKEVIFDEKKEEYTLFIYYRKSEEKDLLRRVRLLGQRVIIMEPERLRKEMLGTALRALNRYEE